MAPTPDNLNQISSGTPVRSPRAGAPRTFPTAWPRNLVPRGHPSRALLPVFALSSVFAAACAAPPRDDIDVARAALERGAAATVSAPAPPACAQARSLLLNAEAETTVQTRRARLLRDYSEAVRLAHRSRHAAEACALEAQAAQARAKERAEQALDALTSMLPRVAALSRHLGDEDIQSDLKEAEIALGEAKTAFDRAEYARAEEAAGRAQARVALANAGIKRLFDSYDASPRRSSWKRWASDTLKESARTGETVILVDKLRRELLVYRRRDELARYPVDLGIGGMSSKVRAGDDATPEGRYRITEVRGPQQTRYYRALMLDYPNAEDLARFRRLKRAGRVSRHDDIGSLIEIHGHGGRSQDWTKGCVALDNADIDDLVPRVRVGTRVTIVGTIPEEVLP